MVDGDGDGDGGDGGTGESSRVDGGVAAVRDEIEQRITDVGDFIRDQRNMAELSLRKLADMAGVSNPYLSQIERGLRKPSAEILQNIAKALEISAETLYVRAGILDEAPTPTGIRDAVAAADELTDVQKQTLLRVYESFQAENAARDAG